MMPDWCGPRSSAPTCLARAWPQVGVSGGISCVPTQDVPGECPQCWTMPGTSLPCPRLPYQCAAIPLSHPTGLGLLLTAPSLTGVLCLAVLSWIQPHFCAILP